MFDQNFATEEQRFAETDFVEVPKFRLVSLLGGAPFLLYLIIVLFVGGIAPFLQYAALLGGILAIFGFGVYWTRCYRIEWDDQRVILRSRRKKLDELDWAEITQIKKVNKVLVLLLDRPHRFLALSAANRVVIPSDMAEQRHFFDALRNHVPPEKFHPNVFPSDTRKHGLRIISGIVAGAAGVAMLSIMSWETSYGYYLWLAFAAIILAGIGGMTLGATNKTKAFAYSIIVLMFVTWSIMMGTLVFGNFALVHRLCGLIAGAMVGLAITIQFDKITVFHRIALTCFTAVIGCVISNFAYNGIKPDLVVEGTLPIEVSPWSPSGDAFIVIEADTTETTGPVVARWYSSEGVRGHGVGLPSFPRLWAIGDSTAFCGVREEGLSAFYLIPREESKAKKIDSGVTERGVVRSFDRTSILYRFTDFEPDIWRQCNLSDGSLRDVQFPMPASMIDSLVWRDDGSFLWMTLSPIVDDEELAEEDAAFCKVWTWKPGDTEPLLRISIDGPGKLWTLEDNGEALVFHRFNDEIGLWEWKSLSTNDPLAEITPATSPYDREELRQDDEGRFVLREQESFMKPLMVEDRETGILRPIICSRGFFGFSDFRSSSKSEMILFVNSRFRLNGPAIQWRRDFEEALKLRSEVCLLKLDDE